MKTEQEKLMEMVNVSTIASMIYKEKDTEYVDVEVTAIHALPNMREKIKSALEESMKSKEELGELYRLLDDYISLLKEVYFVYGVKAGAKMMKELAFE